MAQALVLGATGHLGAHIVRALLADGHRVRAAFRSERFLQVLEGLPVERVRVDLDSLDGLREALAGCAWVFHAAAYYPDLRTSRAQALERARGSTRRVAAELLRSGAERVVFTSSASTIRYVAERPATEADAEPWPLDDWRPLYATVKIAIEHDIRGAHEAGLPLVITNPSLCIGEYDAHPFSGRAVLAFAKYRIPFYLDHDLHTIYTGDVGIGHVRAAERGRLGERYLLTRHQVSVREFGRLVALAAGLPAPRWRLPRAVAYAAACVLEPLARAVGAEPPLTREMVTGTRALPRRLDGSKAARELGLPDTPLEDAVARAVRWFRQHGYC